MNARCAILAVVVAGFEPNERLMRCPSNARGAFHYHGTSGTDYARLTGAVPCAHRHQTVSAAVKCSKRLHAAQEAQS